MKSVLLALVNIEQILYLSFCTQLSLSKHTANKVEKDFEQTFGGSSGSSSNSKEDEDGEKDDKSEQENEDEEKRMKSLDEFLASRPILSIKLKGLANVDCNIDKELASNSLQVSLWQNEQKKLEHTTAVNSIFLYLYKYFFSHLTWKQIKGCVAKAEAKFSV